AAHETPREAADGHPLIQDSIDLPARVFDVDDLVWKQVVVHDLDVVVWPDLFERPAKCGGAFASVIGSDLTNDRVHRMIGTARVDRQPADPARLDPVGKLACRTGVLDEVARLV